MPTHISVSDLLGCGLAPRTAYLYARRLEVFERLLSERGADLVSAGPADIAEVACQFPWSHGVRCQLRGALTHAWEVLGRLDGPVRAVRIPPKPQGRCKALSATEAALLERSAWAREDQAGLAVLVGLYAGLRRAEIAGLAWEHLTRGPGGAPLWLRVLGKGGTCAEVPVHRALAQALQRYGADVGQAGWLFPGRAGGHVSPATVWDWVRLVGAGAGLPGLRPHLLRHTALAEAHDRSADLRAVQQFARHTKPETTLTYTRTTSKRLAEVVGMIDYGRQA